jgi:hypothetical protein
VVDDEVCGGVLESLVLEEDVEGVRPAAVVLHFVGDAVAVFQVVRSQAFYVLGVVQEDFDAADSFDEKGGFEFVWSSVY